MRVRLAVEMSGTRNGVPWPKRGSLIEVPDDEAHDMLRAGTARPLKDDDAPEQAVVMPDNIEEAVQKFIPVTARHTPAGGVELLPDEDRRPIIANLGLTDDGEIAPKYKEGTGLLTDEADVNDTPGLAQSPPALADDVDPDKVVDMTGDDTDASADKSSEDNAPASTTDGGTSTPAASPVKARATTARPTRK